MRYFTDNPLERMMMQAPRQERGPDLSRPAKGHPCHGCKRYGEGCILPWLPGRDGTGGDETQRKEREPMSRLVIAEKPSVAQSIASVLGAGNRKDGYLEGGGYLVSWCFGHLAGAFRCLRL